MDTVQAINKVFLFRILGEEGDAWKVAFQQDAETEESREYDTEPTKDGNVKSAGQYEASHSLSSFLAKGDDKLPKLKKLVRDDNPGKLEVWEVDRTDINDETTIGGDYSVDVVTTVSTSAGAEGKVEVSIDTEVEGTIVSGEIQVTPELKELLKMINHEREFVQPTGAPQAPETQGETG
jgi:TP901-1 family phage major tail protein